MVYTLNFQEIDKSSLPLVGGKGANLGEMTKAGFPVPIGFCVSTQAFGHFIATSPEMEHFYNELNTLNLDDLDALRNVGLRIRSHLAYRRRSDRKS